MKKLGAILLSFTLLISLFPPLTMAAQNTNFEQELIKYLKEVSDERGFEVTKEDIEESLAYYEGKIEEFETVDDLSDFLGEVIKADLSNLDYIYEGYELDEDKLLQVLTENGEDINDYIFLDDLDTAVNIYSFERDPNFDQELVNYLAKVSEERGFEVTREDVEASLALYESSIEEFETVEDLSDFLGEVIKADLSNLEYFNETYGLDKQSLLQLLEENGEDINDYVYLDDLDQTVWTLYEDELPGMGEDVAEELLPIFQAELDLTAEELQRIEDHLLSLEEHLSNPEIIERLEDLGNRMMAFEDFDVASELTAGQIAELASIFDEFLSIFKLKASYSLIKGDSETPLSLFDLFKLDELKGANLKIVLSSTDGKFLADLIITGEMVDSETVIDTGEQVVESADEVTNTVEQSPVVKPEIQKSNLVKKPMKNSAKGEKLPNTASNFMTNVLFGLFIVLAGTLMYRKARNA